MLPGERRCGLPPSSTQRSRIAGLAGQRIGHRLEQEIGDGDLDAAVALDLRPQLLARALERCDLDPAVEGEGGDGAAAEGDGLGDLDPHGRERSRRGCGRGRNTRPLGGRLTAAPSAARISRLRMRPPGPEPVRPFSSIPASPARRRASGEAGMREPAAGEAGAGADAGAGAGFFASATGALPPSPAKRSPPARPPLVVKRPSAAPMGSCVPSGARMDSKVPSAGASTSIAALSVSSSTSASPWRTRWPASFSQRSTLADSIVALSLGTRKSIGEPR